jgi:hypothetical protein
MKGRGSRGHGRYERPIECGKSFNMINHKEHGPLQCLGEWTNIMTREKCEAFFVMQAIWIPSHKERIMGINVNHAMGY